MKLISFGTEMGLQLTMPRIWTPSAIQSYLDQIHTELQALARDVRDAKKQGGNTIINDTELENIKDFYNEVARWLDSKPSTWWGANVTRAQDYEKRINDWRKYIANRGAQISSPEIREPIKHTLDLHTPKLPDLDTSTKVVLGLAAGAALFFGATSLVGKFKGTAAPERA